MNVEVFTAFTKTIQDLLRDGKTDSATKVFNEDKYAQAVQDSSWDLIPILTEHLNRSTQMDNNEVFKCAEHLLNIVGKQSNAEEALLQLISEIEEAKDDINFVVLLQPLFEVILRVSSKKVNSLAWSFNAIQSYVGKCQVPSYNDFEGKERLLVDNDDGVKRIMRLYNEIVIFYDKVLETINLTSEGTKVLCKFLIQLLGKPLCYLNIEEYGTVKTEARCLAKNMVEKVFQTISDLFLLTQMRFENEHDELVKPDDLSLANLFYVVYQKGVLLERLPKVYKNVYAFVNMLYLVTVLLKEDNIISVERGLHLLECILNLVKQKNLSYALLDSKDHCSFCQSITNIIMYNPKENLRKSGLEKFGNYLKVFEVRGVYLIILNLVGSLDHSGLIGYLITFYKDMLIQQFSERDQNISEYFKGHKLFRILRKFCHLPENEETDLITNSDQIICALNLLRYLVIKDKNNDTEIWDFIPVLQSIFLDPLRQGIELSKGHYELKIKELTKENLSTNKDNDHAKSNVSITVEGNDLPGMTKADEINVLNSSLTAFDVMQSILIRVTEYIDNKLD